MSIELHGPFSTPQWRVTIDGYIVPHVHVEFRGGDENGPNWSLIVDNRFATEWVTRAEIYRWAYVVANMGAINAGYGCHGENSKPMNPYHCQLGPPISRDQLAQWQREAMHLVKEET